MTQMRVERLEKLVETLADQSSVDIGSVAAGKIQRGLALTREELAGYLGVSTRKIQRMEAAGTVKRCPNLGTVVRYAARDVLRLASAQ
jgi:predicted phage gp36 major capsid-like protein